MPKIILIGLFFVISSNSFAGGGLQTGCSADVVKEAQSLSDLAFLKENKGLGTTSDSAKASINLFKAQFCAGQISKELTCATIKPLSVSVVASVTAQYTAGITTLSEVLAATNEKNDILASCTP